MTNEEHLKWQKESILEEYFNKTDVKEQPSGKATQVSKGEFNETNRY